MQEKNFLLRQGERRHEKRLSPAFQEVYQCEAVSAPHKGVAAALLCNTSMKKGGEKRTVESCLSASWAWERMETGLNSLTSSGGGGEEEASSCVRSGEGGRRDTRE